MLLVLFICVLCIVMVLFYVSVYTCVLRLVLCFMCYVIWQVSYLFITEVLLYSYLKDETVVTSSRYLVTDMKNPSVNHTRSVSLHGVSWAKEGQNAKSRSQKTKFRHQKTKFWTKICVCYLFFLPHYLNLLE